MNKLSFLLILSTVFAQSGAKELIETEYFLSNILPCDQQHMILRKELTYRHESWEREWHSHDDIRCDSDCEKLKSSEKSTSGHYRWSKCYITSTDTELKLVTTEDGLLIGVGYENFKIIKEAQRKGAPINSQHLLIALESLKDTVSSDDLTFNILKTASSLCTGIAAGVAAGIGVEIFYRDHGNRDWTTATGIGIAATGAGLAASTLTWLGIRKLQNRFRTITAPAVLEYLVYTCDCPDTKQRDGLTKMREIVKQTAAKKHTVNGLKPLEAAIAALPTA